MSQFSPPQIPRVVEPVPYAAVATPDDALMTGAASRAILFGGIALRLVGAYTLVECRRPGAMILDALPQALEHLDPATAWACLVLLAYVGWGLLLVLRGPRLLGWSLRRAVARPIPENGEWSIVALCAAGTVIILWTFEPLLGVFTGRSLFADCVTTFGQLALGVWLFLSCGRLSSMRPAINRR